MSHLSNIVRTVFNSIIDSSAKDIYIRGPNASVYSLELDGFYQIAEVCKSVDEEFRRLEQSHQRFVPDALGAGKRSRVKAFSRSS